jgi:hypothetical protein
VTAATPTAMPADGSPRRLLVSCWHPASRSGPSCILHALLQQVLLERLHTMEADIGPAIAASATPTAAAGHFKQQHQPLSGHICSPLSALPHSAAAAARSYAGAGDRPLGAKTPPRTPDSAKPPGFRGQGRRSITEPSMGGGIDSSSKLTAQTIVSELEVMFG